MAPGARSPLAAGDQLAERYRLETLCSEGPLASLWRATDEVLARPVAVKVVPMTGAGAAVAPAFLAAAGRASMLAAPGLVRVYDAAMEARPGPPGGCPTEVAYVISEWVDGRALPALLAEDGPVDPVNAARLGVDAAEALEAAHRLGLAHGRLHPGNLLITERGRVLLTDTAVAATLAGDVPATLTAQQVAADTRDLAACVYAAVTGRWPGAATDRPDGGIPLAPVTGGRAYAPSQVRAGVPRQLDAVVARALHPDRYPALPQLTTPAALGAALSPIVAEAAAREGATSRPTVVRPPSRLRRAAPWVASFALIGAFATGTYLVGRAIGELPPPPGGLTVLAQPTASARPGAAAPVPLDLTAAGVAVSDYDPDGDQHENPSTVINAYDQDPVTAWMTSTYNSAAFGGLKPGVGLLVDFGQPVTVARVGLGLTAAGADVELRAGNALGANESSLPVVARRAPAKTAESFVVPAGTTRRYWLIWITKLPPDLGSKSRVGISAMVFSR